MAHGDISGTITQLYGSIAAALSRRRSQWFEETKQSTAASAKNRRTSLQPPRLTDSGSGRFLKVPSSPTREFAVSGRLASNKSWRVLSLSNTNRRFEVDFAIHPVLDVDATTYVTNNYELIISTPTIPTAGSRDGDSDAELADADSERNSSHHQKRVYKLPRDVDLSTVTTSFLPAGVLRVSARKLTGKRASLSPRTVSFDES